MTGTGKGRRELAQKSVDQYSKLSTLARSDRLSREDGIPQQLLDEIVSHILSVCGKDLEKIYLVRKTLGRGFFRERVRFVLSSLRRI